ncbi:hypothetical protein [Actinoplanes sp. NPDC026623]|uniref:hypothetical protein n=1 Tax=Actinoplanes sp. NPDC026623 TaxID=3155610 RepID=UPI0033E464EA
MRSFSTANKMAKSMLTVRSADPTDPVAAAACVQHGPAIVQAISQIHPALADYLTRAIVRDTHGETQLNNRGHTAVTIIEEWCLTPLTEAVEQLVGTLILISTIRFDTALPRMTPTMSAQ